MQRPLIGSILVMLLASSVFATGSAREANPCDEGATAASHVDARFGVATQPGVPLCVAIAEADWKAPRWRATLTLHNCSTKAITHVEVEYTEDYEHASGVWSSDGRMTRKFAPGDEMALETNGGFRDGRQYDRPVGELIRLSVGVVAVTFADGTEWHKPTTSTE